MTDYFSGPERLEPFRPMNRLMRMGSPDELKVPDRDRIIVALRRQDFETARRYIDLFHDGATSMVALLMEWALQMPATLTRLVDLETVRSVIRSAHDGALRALEPMPRHAEQRRAIATTLRLLQAEHSETGAALEPPTGRAVSQQAVRSILAEMSGLYDELCRALVAKDERLSCDSFDRSWSFALGAHDACLQLAHSFPAAVDAIVDQKKAERVVSLSFSSCSFFEGLWSLGALPPADLAAFVANTFDFISRAKTAPAALKSSRMRRNTGSCSILAAAAAR